jgi:hypothetical protein
MKKIKSPEDSLRKYYENLFKRNQNKWMRRSKLEEHHLGSKFILGEDEFELIGAVDSTQVLIKKTSDETYYMNHIDEVTKIILDLDSQDKN